MKVVLFCHSLLSDWNNGNAHFQRGIFRELQRRGHDVRAFEPEAAWSVQNLLADAGPEALDAVLAAYPELGAERYRLGALDLDCALDGADLVLAHEWNEPDLIARLARHRARGGRYALLFHDTQPRPPGATDELARHDLSAFDGVLACDESLRQSYDRLGFGARAWTWHEAADVRVFRPHPELQRTGDLVWMGNLANAERSRELIEFLFEPVRRLELTSSVYGARYPAPARALLQECGVEYRGWLPNHRVPEVFARHRATVYVPRRSDPAAVRDSPTIRPLEALACGIPLVSAPWHDEEQLFRPGVDFLVAESGAHMERHLRAILQDRDLALELACAGLETVLSQHTCAHRVDELIDICRLLRVPALLPSSPGSPRLGTTAAFAAEGP